MVSGPSGVGKDTLIKMLLKTTDGIYRSISATTRSPRPGEVDGSDYYFLSKEQFEQDILGGKFLEYAQYGPNYYGTPQEAVETRCLTGEDVLLEIEVQGAQEIKRKLPHAILVFLLPPSIEELERRLRNRGTDSEERILDRLSIAKKEIELVRLYDYKVVNSDINKAADELRCIVQAERLRVVN